MINKKFMNLILLYLTLFNSTSVAFAATEDAQTYEHPGAKHFFEIGLVRNYSVYGYEVTGPYAVPRFLVGAFEIMQSHITYFAYDDALIKFGPMINYVFTPYAGDEIDSLNGMSRTGYLEVGALAEISLPIGRLELTARYPTYNGSRNFDYKINYATGLPALKMNGIYSWLNLQYEFSILSRETSNYFFGVRSDEAKTNRPAQELNSILSHSLIIGYWVPWSSRIWSTFTYKNDWYSDEIFKSPIIVKDSETTFLMGLLYSFN